jgi:hypothetical protein
MFIPLKMVLIGIDPYPYELMTCSLLTKMEQDGTRWNKVHMPWNPSTWFCDPSPPCPKLLPLPTSEPKGGRIPGLNPTIDPSITTTISELPCHQIHQLHVATPHTLKDLTKSKKLRKLRRQLFGVRGRALGHGIQNLQQFQEFLLCILSCKASQVTKVTQIFQNAAGSPFFDFLNCLSEANIDTYSNGSVVFSTSSDHHQPFDHGIMTHLSWILPLPCPGTDCNLPFGAALRADGSCAVKASHFRRI